MIVKAVDGNTVILDNSEPVTIEKLYDELICDEAYLVQSITKNHPELDAITPYLATTRHYNFFEKEGLTSLYPMIKLPAGGNVADNFWRPGNLLASIDSESGKIMRVIQGDGLEQKEISHHPDSGVELTGFTIPFWKEVKILNEQCARLFAPLRFISTDIAITQDGPVVVEVNFGGGFVLPQILYQTGFLTEERIKFFTQYGWKA